ncbi:MAG: chain length determinant protein EpsF [Burkholderiales bacterium]|nr:chain length determinant protein EpsF [Burkholderiales bacterium]
MSFSQLLIILKARWKIIASVFWGVVLLVLVLSLVLPKKYKAETSVLVDVKSPDPIAGMVLPGLMAPGYIATQLDVIQSERVARGAIKLLHLDESAQLQQQWREDTEGVGSFETWLATLLQKGLDIKPSRESSVINITYQAQDPQFAAALANAYVQSYIDTTLELRIEPAKQYSALFETQAKQLRERLEQAQSRLSAYQKEKGLIASDERLDVENVRLNDLSTQLVGLQALSAESRSRKAEAGANSTEVLNNMVVATLKSDLSRQEAHVKELTAQYGSAYPQVRIAQASVDELRERIAAETRRVNSSLGINNTVNQSREAQVKAALEQQREKLLKLKDQRDEASVLTRDVESAQRAYELMNQRLSQTAVESQSTQTNVSVVKRATPPPDPSSPRLLLNMILAIVVGGMLSIAVALIAELRDRRLRTDDDVTEGLDVPMLGIIPLGETAPSTKKWLGRNRAPLLSNRSLPELAGPRA